MAYAFNNDKSRYELASLLQRVSNLENLVAALTGDVSVLDNMQQDIDEIESSLGLDANIAKKKFWASPVNGSGHASFRGIDISDLPSGIPVDKLGNFGVVEDHRWGYDRNWPIHCESGAATGQWTPVGAITLGAGNYIITAGIKFSKKAGGFRHMVIAADTETMPTAQEAVCFSSIDSCVENRFSYINAVRQIHLTSDHTYFILAQQTSGDNLQVWANARVMHLGSNALANFVDTNPGEITGTFG